MHDLYAHNPGTSIADSSSSADDSAFESSPSDYEDSSESPAPPTKRHKTSAAQFAGSTFTHIPPADSSLTGEAFYQALLDAGQIRSYDAERFYCGCRPLDARTGRGGRNGCGHWNNGKGFQKGRWNLHAATMEKAKPEEPTMVHEQEEEGVVSLASVETTVIGLMGRFWRTRDLDSDHCATRTQTTLERRPRTAPLQLLPISSPSHLPLRERAPWSRP